MVVHICNLSILEAEVGGSGGSGVQGPPWLHIKFKAILGYLRPCLKTNQIKTKYAHKNLKVTHAPVSHNTVQNIRGSWGEDKNLETNVQEEHRRIF